MQLQKLLLIAFTCLLFCACKKDGEDGGETSVLQITDVLDKTKTQFYQLGAANNLTPEQAIMETATWLSQQENVVSAAALDSAYIIIELTNGLRTSFQFSLRDQDGYSIYRGSAAGMQYGWTGSRTGGSCTDVIQNDKVLIYAAGHKEFYKPGEMAAVASLIASTDKELDVTVLVDEQCKPEKVEQFGNYGLVILDTHGMPDGFMSGIKLQFSASNKPENEAEIKAAIVQQNGQSTWDKILAGYLTINSLIKIKQGKVDWHSDDIDTTNAYEIYIHSKYIKSLPKMPNTVIMGNMCYSGYGIQNTYAKITEPIRLAFLDLNPISYYAYAQSNQASRMVTDFFAKKMEQHVINRLIIDVDSTKIVNLKPNNVDEYKDTVQPGYNWPSLFFKHYGKDTYCYGCGANITDARDGRSYKTVCIDNQVWMAEDLKYNAQGSLCYDNDAANCNNYGRLYDWATVMQGDSASYSVPSGVRGICPEGWHLPSKAEWQILVSYLGGNSVAGGALRDTVGWDAPNNGATNSSGFSAKPGGYENGLGDFSRMGAQVHWWSTTADNFNSGYYHYVTTDISFPSIAFYSCPSELQHFSCRCVKD